MYAGLEANGIPAFQCTLDDVEEAHETITYFVVDNRLESIVVASNLGVSPPEFLERIIEEAGIGRLAVSWVDLTSLLGEQPSEGAYDSANMLIMVNLARLQHADLTRDAVFRSLPRNSKVSRRELFRFLPRVLKVESNIPIVLHEKCGARSQTCDYCRLACPVKAVSVTGSTLAISNGLCTECGACARECPIGAIQCPSFSDVQMIAMLNALSSNKLATDKRALTLTCHKGFEKLLNESKGGKHLGSGIVPVQIPCVASVGSVHYLWSASVGVTLVTVCPDTSCNKAMAMLPRHQHAAYSEDLLKNTVRDRSASVYHIALNANDSLVDSISRTVTLIHPVDTSVELRFSRREAVLDGIRALGAGEDTFVDLSGDDVLPLFDLKVDDERCSFCEFCKRDCPDHAIEFTKNEASTSLMFDPALCGGCMICEKNCPEHAIGLSRLREFSAILVRKNVEKARDENAKCENCGTTLGSKRSLTLLRKRLSEQGIADSALRTVGLCIQCKKEAILRPLGQYMSN